MIKHIFLFFLFSTIAACQSQEIKPTMNRISYSEDMVIRQEYIVKPVASLTSQELLSVLNEIGCCYRIKHKMSANSFLVVYNGSDAQIHQQFEKLNNHDQIQFASLNGVKH